MARFVRQDSLAECLVWEACRAGRPEVVFERYARFEKAAEYCWRSAAGCSRRFTISSGKAFPGVRVEVRYGRFRNYPKVSDIVLASTPQALKYYLNFDLVILDERMPFPTGLIRY